MSQSGGYPPGGQPPPGAYYPHPPQPQQVPPGQAMPGIGQLPAPPQGQPGYYYPPPMKQKDETLALVSLLLAVASWIFGMTIFTAIPAVVVGIMARRRIKQDPEHYGGDGMALGGIVMGIVMTVLFTGIAVVWLLAMLVPLLMGIIMAIVGVGASAAGV